MRLGQKDVRVAILSAMESVNPDVPSTLEAAALCKMADRGQITGAVLDGPLALDNAISPEAAAIKKIASPVAGRANVLVVPDLEAGNMLAKSLSFLAGADAAGIVLGARVPIILTSRADERDRAARVLRGRRCSWRRRGGPTTVGGHSVGRTAQWPNASRSSTPDRRASSSRSSTRRRRRPAVSRASSKISASRRACPSRMPAASDRSKKEWQAKEIDHRTATTIILETAIGLLGGRPVAGDRPPGRAWRHAVRRAGRWSTEDVIAALKTLCPLAPLHQPHNLAPIEAIAAAAPHIPQVACFDTAFHQAQPELAQTFALPRETHRSRESGGMASMACPTNMSAVGLREVAPDHARQARSSSPTSAMARASARSDNGRSVATTMGFTAVDGLMMGTRCGVDRPRRAHLPDGRAQDGRAGDRGADLQEIRACSAFPASRPTCARCARPTTPRRAKRSTCSSIGSSAKSARWPPRWAGWTASSSPAVSGNATPRPGAMSSPAAPGSAPRSTRIATRSANGSISADHSALPIWVIPTDEERVIARHTAAILAR